MSLYVGVDLGGTNVVAGIVTEEGEVITISKRSLDCSSGKETALQNIMECINTVITESGRVNEIEGIGVGSPAPIDINKGTIILPINLPELHNTSLIKLLEDKFGLPAYLDNDANVATIGEHWMGAGRGSDHFIMLTLGTGIGGGIITHGQILRGALGNAAELGHLSIEHDGPPCSCNNRGCFELYASATAVTRRTINRIIQENPKTLIKELVKKDLDKINTEIIFQAAQAGDPFAIEIFEETGYFLGAGIASLLAIFNSDTVALGGGLAQAGDYLLKPTLATLDQRRWIDKKRTPAKVVLCELGDKGAIIGAAKMARNNK